METYINFLGIYASITIAFVAFATITATLRQSFGKGLTSLQYLLFRFFVEVGLIHVVQAIFPIALLWMSIDEPTIWRLSTYSVFVGLTLYFPFYVRRRTKINAPTPLVSLLVMIGYGVVFVLLALTALELYWPPSRTTVSLYLMWVLISSIAIFWMVLGSFVEVEDETG